MIGEGPALRASDPKAGPLLGPHPILHSLKSASSKVFASDCGAVSEPALHHATGSRPVAGPRRRDHETQSGRSDQTDQRRGNHRHQNDSHRTLSPLFARSLISRRHSGAASLRGTDRAASSLRHLDSPRSCEVMRRGQIEFILADDFGRRFA